MSEFSKRDLMQLSVGAGIFAIMGFKGKPTPQTKNLVSQLAAVEKEHGGRLGFFIRNRAGTKTLSYRGGERFGMCSTFKFALAAAILKKVDEGKISMDAEIPLHINNLKPFSDYMKSILPSGKIKVKKALEEIMIYSDNISANSLMAAYIPPEGITAQLRAWGDKVTDLRHIEPEVNIIAGDGISDTTTPIAYAASINTIIFGKVLSAQSNKFLRQIMVGAKTGVKRLKAGLPDNYILGHKTGTAAGDNMVNRYNDVGFIIAPNGQEYCIACFYEADKSYEDMRPQDEMALQKAGAIAADFIKGL